jgi:hypothetical protein
MPAYAQCAPQGATTYRGVPVGMLAAGVEQGRFEERVNQFLRRDSRARSEAEAGDTRDARGAAYSTATRLRDEARKRLVAKYGTCPAGQYMRGVLEVPFSDSEMRGIFLDELRGTRMKRAYSDEFLSETEEAVTVVSTANLRDYPSTSHTEVMFKLEPGRVVTGRWVQGVDSASRWFLTTVSRSGGRPLTGYVWEGNLRRADSQ